jgi:hypothetical protein
LSSSSYLLLLLLPRSAVRDTVVELGVGHQHSVFVCSCGKFAREEKSRAGFRLFEARYVRADVVLLVKQQQQAVVCTTLL